MIPCKPDPVKLFSGIIFSDDVIRESAVDELQSRYGSIDFQSQTMEFNLTDYYVPEMGAPLFRVFIAFDKLIMPDEIAGIKCETNALEDRLAVAGQRKVNLDPGYMDFDKIVLASAKYNGQKIYLKRGIWADLTLRFERGRFMPYPWSFPDFKTGMYEESFLEIRRLYKRQRKN